MTSKRPRRSRDHEILELLHAHRGGDGAAREELFTMLYDDLRRLASRHMVHESPDHTLAPTSLVHEVYLRLEDAPFDCEDRDAFLRLASTVMRRTLIDSARRRRVRRRASLDEIDPSVGAIDHDRWVLELEPALTELESLDADLTQVVNLRFFAGLDVSETARALDISTATVKRRWRTAKAWLEAAIRRRATEPEARA